MRSPDRFVVFNVGQYGKRARCSRRVYTSYGDAAKATLHCSRQSKRKGVASTTSKPCLLLHGLPGTEKLVGSCFKGKCGPPQPRDRTLLTSCGEEKRERRGLIAQRAKALAPSKASKSGVVMSGLGRKRRKGRR